ncbi:hypothetical protein Y032_0166g73 [Ancylostoma ceylanicum]|uniref:Uncharacterized protein n=1 Tax=Ancylostoma ceylanicum TaxID=53326 RepID=A0A016SWM8_9BILA|nr:hypothetical protein Y032_0166g73 [Ancylostoma ceylanicum]
MAEKILGHFLRSNTTIKSRYAASCVKGVVQTGPLIGQFIQLTNRRGRMHRPYQVQRSMPKDHGLSLNRVDIESYLKHFLVVNDKTSSFLHSDVTLAGNHKPHEYQGN